MACSLSVFAGSVLTSTLATNTVQVTTTNTLTGIMGIEGQTNAIVQIKFELTSGASVSNQVLTLEHSFDGSAWSDSQTVTIAATGSNQVVTITNIPVALPLLRLTSWENKATNGAVTNISVKYYKE